MNITIPNQISSSIMPNPVSLYDNGHFFSEIKSSTAPVAYSSFQKFTDTSFFELEFTDFDAQLKFDITGVEGGLESDEIVLYLNHEDKLSVQAILKGYWKQDTKPTFQVKSFGMKLGEKQETPISMFLTSTLWAMLGLSSKFKVHIPQLNYNLTTSFELSVDKVSKLLQERQIAYRLLVIESATGVKLPFPHQDIQGEDIESIAFCYHAIVEREFDWFSNPIIIPLEANQENLSLLPETNEPDFVNFKPEYMTKFIFGVEVNLGFIGGKIEKFVINNYEEVKEKLLRLDNGIVNGNQGADDGLIKMMAIDVPQLPPNPWSKKLQKLINLENKLDEKVLDKYFNLAGSTLDGLTEEQKEIVTAHPNLSGNAFTF